MALTVRLALGAAALAAATSLLALDRAGDGPQAAAAEAASASPATADAAAQRSWQYGSLRFVPCEIGAPNSGVTTAAWCNDFEVPEDRAHPDGRRIHLKLAVIRSEAGDAALADPLVLLAGGPGQAATESFAATGWYADLLRHRHAILLDQRGTGGSNPLTCKDTAAALDEQAADSSRERIEQAHEATRKCLAEISHHADPRFYTTTDAVADLEAVRQALGAPQLNLYGVSYGTRMAQQYLMRHPDAVRSVVLDSPVPNQLVLGEDFAQNLQQALEAQFARCAATPACKERFGEPMATLLALKAKLEQEPHEFTIRDPRTFAEARKTLDADALVSVVRMFAYTPATAALIPLAVDQASRGDATALLGQAALVTGDLATSITGGMELSVICSEDADLLQPRAEDATTVLGTELLDTIRAQCAGWPRGTRPADFHAPLKSDKPVLILSGEFDPVTPRAYGDAILLGLPHGRHLTAPGQGHSVGIGGCMPQLVASFIDEADATGLDADCLARLGPTPFFLDFNGAAP